MHEERKKITVSMKRADPDFTKPKKDETEILGS